MIKDERVLELIEIIKKKKRIAVKELAEITFSSTSTLRRDLIFLENQGLIKRKHGYVTLSSMNTIELSHQIREGESTRQKRLIASLAKDFIRSGMCIYLDSSTTVYELCPYLSELDNLIIFTNGLHTAQTLSETVKDSSKIFITSGEVKHQSCSVVNYDKENSLLDHFNIDLAFCSARGIDDQYVYPQLFTPNLKTIQNPCLSLDPGWFLFSPNGCFLLDKKEFPLYGISVEKNTKRKETHMNSLPNHHFQNKSFYQLSFDGGHLTQYGGLIFFQELFSQLKLKERISKYLVTNDQRRYCRYSDSDILVQFLFQLLTGYGTDYACKELSADAYFPKLLEGGQLASQPTLSRFLSRTDEETVHSLRCLNLELVEFFLQFHQLNQLIVDIDSTHFTTYGKQEGVAYNAHYRAHGYHPLYAFEGKTGYCFNAQLRPGNRYCSEEADSFITPVLERFNQLLFRMDSGFATPKLYDLIEKTGQYYLIKLKKNTVLSRLGDLSLPCPQDEDLTILPHSAYSETLYQAGSWSHKRRVCQFSERKEGNLFYDVISLVTNMTSGTSQDQFQLYRGRGQAENFIKEMKEGFFGDKTDSSTLIKNEVRMMMSCIAYNLYLFLKHLAGGDFQTLTIKRFRHLFLHVVGKCVRTGRKQLLKLSSLYAYSELFSALYSRIRKVNLNLPVPYEPPRRKASLMMH